MPTYCYKKRDAKVQLYLASGYYLKFDQVEMNVAIYGTDDAAVAGQIDAMTASGRGGVTKISASEFDAFMAKKKASRGFPSRWREELSNQEIKTRPKAVKGLPTKTDEETTVPSAAKPPHPVDNPRVAILPEGGFIPKAAAPFDPEE